MRKLKLLQKILRVTGMWHLIMGFLTFFLISGFVICVFEPSINHYEDALWYLFASFTTIGYGDFAATTLIGRIATVIVSFYGILIVAFIPAVVIGYMTEVTKMKAKQSLVEFIDELENLPNLSKEELVKLSEQIKKYKAEL